MRRRYPLHPSCPAAEPFSPGVAHHAPAPMERQYTGPRRVVTSGKAHAPCAAPPKSFTHRFCGGAEDKRNIVNALNEILSRPDFYQAQAFSELTLPEEVQDLLNQNREELSSSEIGRLNGPLIETALPHDIATNQKPGK